MVCEMTVSASGKLTGYKHYEAVMNSHARLTYNKVWAILQGNPELREQYAPLVKDLEELHSMYQVLEKAREQRGGISFETEEAKFIFNAERRIERVERTVRNDAHKLIEECMILANIASRALLRSIRSGAVPRSRSSQRRQHQKLPFRAGRAGPVCRAAINRSRWIMPSCWKPSPIVPITKCCKRCCCVQ